MGLHTLTTRHTRIQEMWFDEAYTQTDVRNSKRGILGHESRIVLKDFGYQT